MDHPDDPSIPRPCPVPLSAMEPRERGHHCRQCDTLVVDAARHTRAEFLALLHESRKRGERLCAQMRSDGDGRVLFADSKLKRRLTVVAFSAALAACGDDATGTPPPPGTPISDIAVGTVAPPVSRPPPAPPPAGEPSIAPPGATPSTAPGGATGASDETSATPTTDPGVPSDDFHWRGEVAPPHRVGRVRPPRHTDHDEDEDPIVGLVAD